MSITAGLPRVQEKGHQKSFHQRHDSSGELDVFEAADYFSGANEKYVTPRPKMTKSSGRMSLDISMMSSKRSSIPAPTHHATKDEKKYKQPNSPGAKLASFLNSLFNQTSSKKKKSMKDHQDYETGRRRRRNSISQFRSLNTNSSNCNSDSKSSSFYSSTSSSEFKTPAHILNKNSSKDFQSHSYHNPDVTVSTLSKINNNNTNVHVKSSSSLHKKDSARLDEERFNFWTSNEFLSAKYNTFVDEASGDKINHSEDDGANSDSSSDLFELQNYDLVSCCSSDHHHLPVYDRCAPTANGAI